MKTVDVILNGVIDALNGVVGAEYKGENGNALLALDMGILADTMNEQDEEIERLETVVENLVIDKAEANTENAEMFTEFADQLDTVLHGENWQVNLAMLVKKTQRQFDVRR